MNPHYDLPPEECPVLDTAPCAFDGLEYPSCFMVKGEFNPSLDRYDKVYSGNLNKYKQLLKSIAL